MKNSFKDIFNKRKVTISTDNFSNIIAEQQDDIKKIKDLEAKLSEALSTMQRLEDRDRRRPNDPYINNLMKETVWMIKTYHRNLETLKNKNNIKEADEEDIVVGDIEPDPKINDIEQTNTSDIINEKFESEIIVEDDFNDDGIQALYEVGTDKYNLTFTINTPINISAKIFGEDKNIIEFLITVCDMFLPNIKEKYPKLNFKSYEEWKNKNAE